MAGGGCGYRSGVTDPWRPTVTLLDRSLSQRTDAVALQLETDTPDARAAVLAVPTRLAGRLGTLALGACHGPSHL